MKIIFISNYLDGEKKKIKIKFMVKCEINFRQIVNKSKGKIIVLKIQEVGE